MQHLSESVDSPEVPDVDAEFRPAVYRVVGSTLAAFTRVYFRYRFRGTGHIPTGPCLFVGNHSAIGVADVLCLLGAWWETFGERRRVVGMMHDLFVDMPGLGWICRSFGAVRAHRDAAHQAIARGHDVAAFPGGGLDACRPVSQARDVVFGPRRGYVRLALETGVPIVPVVTLGSHFTYLLLPFGERFGRAIGWRRVARTDAMALPVASLLVAAAAAAVLAGIAPAWWMAVALALLLLPNPVRVTSVFLPPIDLRAATAHIADPAERIEAGHALVHGVLSEQLRHMQHD